MREDIEIDPEMQPILAEIAGRMASLPGISEVSVEEMRKRAEADLAYWNEDPPTLPRIVDIEIPGPRGRLAARVYYPSLPDAPLAGLIYFHGGGWVIGSLDTEDRSLRQLAIESGVAIVSVAYGLAPDHKFPAPVEDCVAAAQWVADNAARLGMDPGRLAVGGASSGANLAVATALSLRNEGRDWLRFMLLFYGVFSDNRDSASYARFGGGDFFLSREAMDCFLQHYLSKPEEVSHPLVSPVRAELGGLPPAFLCVAGLDPLRDDSYELAWGLEAAGVAAELVEYPGVVHGFTLMGRAVGKANEALADAGAALAKAVSRVSAERPETAHSSN